MDFQTSFCVLLVLFIGLISSSQVYNFSIGGKDGWTVNPSEKYNHWAERNRFLINNTLTFKYKNGSDSVLVVSRDDYKKCNTEKPILRMDGGDSVFKFEKSGPFFFISGNKSSCEKGQRLIVIVLSERHHPSSPPPICQIPASAPSGTTPVSPSASPSAATPTSSSPVCPPVYAPMPASWSPSPSPLASSPTPAPLPAKASAPGLATSSALLIAAVVIVLSVTFGVWWWFPWFKKGVLNHGPLKIAKISASIGLRTNPSNSRTSMSTRKMISG